ncbi:hypothetical protein BCL76_11990 [Streptomyces sp. CG 926]|uniref:hypothetical protein n=1 Tax=Streptomyces sp. CG 926 TaxID=1882405 RepID=UPI000D6CD776|nr:hypothetical protein [Streptomyces sp. CG 926]PWK63664.1 hypothetical protein BCL76_11990 [Streptomyces sp. CG 926]
MTGEPTAHDTHDTHDAENTRGTGRDPASGGSPPQPGDRLRPGTAVTPLRAGLHLRGRRGSLTLEGSTAVPVVWGLLEEPLRTGGLAGFREGLEPGSAVRAAADTLLGRLADHDLLLPAPPAAPHPDPAVARWIDATAAHPDAAAALLATARAEVLAHDPNSPTATAALRALTAGGVPVTLTPDPDLPPDRILLTVHGAGPDRTVAAGRGGATGYVTAPGSTAQARADAAALEARLTHATTTVLDSAAEPQPRRIPGTFAALLAGAAAHRLLCAAARLPDPATEADDPRLLPGIPTVLLADPHPPRADHHSWLGPERIDADRHVHLAPPTELAEALRRIAALGEHRSGPLPAPLPGDLPQLPVPLAACTPPAAGHATTPRTLTGGGPRLDLARLELFCRAAELLLGETTFTVGADPGHARGRTLRHTAARRLAAAPHDRPPLDPAHWSGHPQLRHWWTTLTGRLAVPARLEVHRAAPHAHAYRAVVRRTPQEPEHGPGPGHGPGPLLGEAVEATPGDAAAFAALAAVTAVTAAAAAAAAPGAPPPPSGGAAAPLAAAGVPTATWEDPGWTGGWLADLAGREEALQDTLHRLYGARPTTTPPAPAPAPAPDPGLAGLLRSFGFTVLHTPEEHR